MSELAWHFVGDTLRDGRPVPADWADIVCLVEPHQWRPTIREAIDLYLDQESGEQP